MLSICENIEITAQRRIKGEIIKPMEITLGTILLLIILVKTAKPNFFNFGTVINHYDTKDKNAEKLPATKIERKQLSARPSKAMQKKSKRRSVKILKTNRKIKS